MLQVSAHLQYGITGFANGITVRELLAFPRQFGICDHLGSYSEGQKDENHLVPRPHTAQHTAAFLQQFWWECPDHPPYSSDLAPNDIFSALCRSILAVNDFRLLQNAESCLTVFRSQSLEFYAERIHPLNKMWQMPKPSAWLFGKIGHSSPLSCKVLFWKKILAESANSHYVFLLSYRPTHFICSSYQTWYEVLYTSIHHQIVGSQ